ncbi:MAG: polysaccharide biosynthesis protein [Bacteroidota bacterium]|nr:polysaccharide biosynthesis protein [Bacteroidota bacterium]
MKTISKKLGSINFSKISEWSRLISLMGSTQVLIQIVGLVSGIMVIRLLPPHEYALYTLANTMLGTMVVLADGGIASAVMSQGGKVWMEHEKLGAVLVTGMNLRRRFAIVSLPLSSGILLYFLRIHGASWLFSILIVLSIIPTFFMMIHSGILEISPKLRQDISSLQKVRVGATIGRLAMLSLTLFAFPLAVVALLATSLPQLWTNIRYRKISSNYADLKQDMNPAVEKDILKMVWKLLPEAIYYCLSGQITIWLISVFGATAAVAQVGALSRLSVVLGFFSILFANIVAPRFARLPNNSKTLLFRYLQIQAGLMVLCIFITFGVWGFSSQILWVLGRNYYGLDKELVLMVISSCLSLLYGAAFLLGTYRSWVINPVVFISVSIITTVSAIVFMDTSSLQDIIILNIIVTSVEVLMLMIFNIIKILHAEETHAITKDRID